MRNFKTCLCIIQKDLYRRSCTLVTELEFGKVGIMYRKTVNTILLDGKLAL